MDLPIHPRWSNFQCKMCHVLIRDSFMLSVGRNKCKTSIYGWFHVISHRGWRQFEIKRQSINAATIFETPFETPHHKLAIAISSQFPSYYHISLRSYAISASLSIFWLSPFTIALKNHGTWSSWHCILASDHLFSWSSYLVFDFVLISVGKEVWFQAQQATIKVTLSFFPSTTALIESLWSSFAFLVANWTR